MNRYIINSSYNKIELYFDNKPNEKILSLLKQNGWRWNQFDKNWSARKTEENLYFAKKVCPSNATPKVSASTQKVIPAINTVSFGQVSDAGETVGVVISKNNGRFNITSSKNMIKCVDCGKFISIHSLFCVSCGCSISHVVQTLFDEQARIKIKEIEQEILAEKKKQAEHNAEKERLKDKIRRMSNSYEDYSLIYEQNLDTEIVIPERGVKKQLVDMALENAKETLETRLSFILKEKEPLEELQELLGLDYLKRIEIFDNSNTFGEMPVSGMVVYIHGKKARKEYRKYLVKTVEEDVELLFSLINAIS